MDANYIDGIAAAVGAYAGEGIDRATAAADSRDLAACVSELKRNEARNEALELCYEGKTPLSKVPDFVPEKYRALHLGCPWPEVAVQSVVERSQFDSYVFADRDGDAARAMRELADRCDVSLGYSSALTDCLVFGVSFAVIVREDGGGAGLRWHSARSAAALWDFSKNRVRCGFAIVGRTYDSATSDYVPSAVDFYTERGVWEITRASKARWVADWKPDALGRCRMVALRFRPDGRHPLGRSRINVPMRDIVREYMANALDIHVASEYTAIGQKWVTNLSDEQLASFKAERWRFSGDTVVMATDNADGDGAPQFGSFAQQSMEPLLSVKRSLATDFCAAASIPISEVLTSDSNPTSGDALAAAKDKLISLVESVNKRNRSTIRDIGLMLLAVDTDRSLADLTDEERAVMVHFRDPSTPSVAACADSAMKLASVAEGYAKTDVFYERAGFDEPERVRIKQQIQDAAASVALDRALGLVE